MNDGTTITVRQFGADQYVLVEGADAAALHATAAKWMHLAAGGPAADNPLSPARIQATSGAALVKTVKSAHREQGRNFAGTVDLSKDATALPGVAPSRMRSVPFTAALDAWGRFVSLDFDLNPVATGAGALRSSYFDYGVPIHVDRPATADTVPMPAAFQQSIAALVV
jgi:hypothetical protein